MKYFIILICSLLNSYSYFSPEEYYILEEEISYNVNPHHEISVYHSKIRDKIYEKLSKWSKPPYKNEYLNHSAVQLWDRAEMLTRLVGIISRHYGVSGFALLGLIEEESKFNIKTATINGTGLTQFTNSGVLEILQQFGLKKAKSGHTNSMGTKILWINIYEELLNILYVNDPSNVYEIPLLFVLNKELKKTTWKKSVKNLLIKYPALSIVFSAMYLKILLRSPCRGLSNCKNWSNFSKEGEAENSYASRIKMESLYGIAFSKYNRNPALASASKRKKCPFVSHQKGEQTQIKECYQEIVTRNMYDYIDIFYQ